MRDPRTPEKIQYPLGCLVGAGILLFAFRLGSRRRFNEELRHHPEAEERFRRLLGVSGVPHGDTLERTFARLDPEEVQEMVTGVFAKMQRNRHLESFRFGKRYVVALDMTGTVTYRERHCPHCLVQDRGEEEQTYYHPVLEAKVVHSSGLALSVMSEFVENPHSDVETQDSELAAFERLARRLKARFPHLPLLLTFDGLYACDRVFSLCERFGWKYVAVLRDGRIPTLNREFEELASLDPGNRLAITLSDGERRTYRWANGLHHQGRKGSGHAVHVLDLVIERSGKKKPSHWRWVTNLPLNTSNVDAVADRAGRVRWKIENEGFNVQKTGGYGLEHGYSANPISAKVFYFLLQLGHLLHQLLERGSLLKDIYPERRPLGRRLASLLLEAWRNAKVWSWNRLEELELLRFQIRLDTS